MLRAVRRVAWVGRDKAIGSLRSRQSSHQGAGAREAQQDELGVSQLGVTGTAGQLSEGGEQRAAQAPGWFDVHVAAGRRLRSAMEGKEQGQVVSPRKRSYVAILVVA